MSAASRDRFAAVVRSQPVDLARACLLIGCEVDPHLDVEAWVGVLDRLAADVPPGDAGDPARSVDRLQLALGVHAGFAGTPEDYADLRASLLHEVLRRRRGLPILLSVVWVEVARRAGIAAYGVGLPGHFVVGVGDPGGRVVLCDPYAGGRALTAADAAALVAGSAGVAVQPEDLLPAAEVETVLRVLTNIRMLSARRGTSLDTVRVRLWATELSLLLPRHPLVLRRERGELLVRLGDYLTGAAELEAYADLITDVDDAAASATRRAARLARSRCN